MKFNTAHMSPDALARCRRLEIDRREKNGLVVLSVIDPRQNGKVVATYRARTEADVQRIRRAYLGQYRVPEELVTEIGGNNAGGTNEGTSQVHEPGGEILESIKG